MTEKYIAMSEKTKQEFNKEFPDAVYKLDLEQIGIEPEIVDNPENAISELRIFIRDYLENDLVLIRVKDKLYNLSLNQYKKMIVNI